MPKRWAPLKLYLYRILCHVKLLGEIQFIIRSGYTYLGHYFSKCLYFIDYYSFFISTNYIHMKVTVLQTLFEGGGATHPFSRCRGPEPQRLIWAGCSHFPENSSCGKGFYCSGTKIFADPINVINYTNTYTMYSSGVHMYIHIYF
jgi:hypothetical protein